jgi:hypothetical protein
MQRICTSSEPHSEDSIPPEHIADCCLHVARTQLSMQIEVVKERLAETSDADGQDILLGTLFKLVKARAVLLS